MAVSYTDFSDYTTGAQPFDWQEQQDAAASVWEVLVDALATGGKVLRWSPTGASGAVVAQLIWEAVAQSTTQEIACRFRRSTGIQVGQRPLLLSSNYPSTTESGYVGLVSASEDVRLRRMTDRVAGTTLDEELDSLTVLEDTWYGARLTRANALVMFAIWLWDSGAADYGESTAIVVSATDGTPLAAGYVGVGIEGNTASPTEYVEFDIVGASDAGETAPLGPPATPTVTLSIARTTLTATGSAYSNPLAHAATQVRYKREDTDAIIYGPVTLSGVVTHEARGVLTRYGVLVYAEMRYQSSAGLWSDWGVSGTVDPYMAAWSAGALITHVDVLIERPAGESTVMQSYRDFGGRNWIKSLSLARPSVNTPIGSGTLTLHRQVGEDSLAPRVTESALNQDGGDYAPALDFGREIEIRTAQEPAGVMLTATATSGVSATSVSVDPVSEPMAAGSFVDWTGGARSLLTAEADTGETTLTVAALNIPIASGELGLCSIEPVDEAFTIVFQGLTDDIEWPRKSGDISVPFRDWMGALSEVWVRDETAYGDLDTPVDAFVVMQEIVDDWAGAGQFALDDLTTGARFLVTRYIVNDVTVFDALQTLALQWGGKSIRSTWNEAESEFRVAVIEPDREKEDPDYSISPSTYIEVHQISTGVKNVRTIVRGQAIDRETGELLTVQIPEEVDIGTDPLVDLYGPRPLKFTEDSNTSAIDTLPELTAMVESAYADVSTPLLPIEIETPYSPWANVDDLVRWLPNTLLWDENLDAAVTGLADDFPGPGKASTRWRGAPKPKGAIQAWINKGAEIAGINKRPGILSFVLTHDPTGILNATVDFTGRTDRYRLWGRGGASPVVAGVPDDAYGQGGEYLPEIRVVSWSVRDGTHHVHLRAYGPGGAYAEATQTIVISGVGGEGEGGTAPGFAPGTPVLDLGNVVGSDQEVIARWTNTIETLPLKLEYFVDGALTATTTDTPAAGETSDVQFFAIGTIVWARLQYHEPPDPAGPWTVPSNRIMVTGTA